MIAKNVFTYLRESRAKIEIAHGDARLSMEAEPPENYDVIAVDAFFRERHTGASAYGERR